MDVHFFFFFFAGVELGMGIKIRRKMCIWLINEQVDREKTKSVDKNIKIRMQ